MGESQVLEEFRPGPTTLAVGDDELTLRSEE